MNNKLLIVISLIILLIVLITLFRIFSRQGGNTQVTPTVTPTNALISGVITPQITPFINTESNTGGTLDNPPQPELDLSNQKTALIERLPVNEPAFTITMDYNDGKFLVVLNEPKESNRSLFESWLNNNYPAIPIDRFKFQ